MFYILFWLILCFVTAIIASSKNRSAILWFFISFIVSPLIGIICVACMPAIAKNEAQAHPNENVQEDKSLYRDCPECAEEIKCAARKCKHCGSEVVPQEVPQAEHTAILDENADGQPCSICKSRRTHDLYNGVAICNQCKVWN